jgi:hypothetical protein
MNRQDAERLVGVLDQCPPLDSEYKTAVKYS